MGMDVYGKNKANANTEDGRNYFRASVWWWRPLVDQMEAAAPELFAKVKYWGTNDGDGFDNAEDCIAMADALDKMERYVDIKKAMQEAGIGDKQFLDYPHDWEFTQEWIAFLRGCGGFEIC